ncbi:MAG TPA: FAD-dependent oxidoreductase [Fimbriimonas sp.]|nr:FAD-dependent oxidoreductase [Fimbriimonas sp.]
MARVVVLGGGFGGAYAAQVLSGKKQCELTVLDRNNFLLFYPLLVEAGVGALEPRHVVVPLRLFMPNADFKMAEVQSVDLSGQRVQYQVFGSSETTEIGYDHLILALGSITRIPDLPGLREYGFEFKSLTDAVDLRDRGIRLLELANTVSDEKLRRDILRHVVVGANFTGIEFAGEYHAFLCEASEHYQNVEAHEIEMIVLEHGKHILPAVRPDLSEWAERTLTKRGVDIRPQTTITEVGEDWARLTTGERLATRTVVWAAGIAPNPLIAKIEGLPLNEKGYIDCDGDLRVRGLSNVWAVGDCATVYDASGKPYAATAQSASRQGPLAAKNILAVLDGKETKRFTFKPLGAYAAIGRRAAAAEVLGHSVKGFFGWFLYRGTYLAKMPTVAMKIRIAVDWALELILKSPIVQLGVHRPRRD